MAKKTNMDLVAGVRKAVDEHWPYCYGTYGKEFSESILQSKTAQYPQHYTPERMAQYHQWAKEHRRTADCIGLIKGIAWTREDGTIGYGINGVPDKSANDMYALAKVKGNIRTMPEVPGLGLHLDGHAGTYLGNGWVGEERGFKFGAVYTRLNERPWLHWYEVPGYDYSETNTEQSMPDTLGLRTLKKGCTGEDVETLQKLLIQIGYALPRYGADGDYGTETVSAVAAFQQEHGLEVDGIYGKMSHAALMEAVSTNDDEAEQAKLPDKWLEVTGGTVNVRKGAGTAYSVLTVVRKGERLRVVGEADGWHAVMIGDETGWIGPKYTKVVE